MNNNECIVTFTNGERKVSLDFTVTESGDLDMKMGIVPEFKEGDEPDLPLLLANTFIEALKNTEKEDGEIVNEEPHIVS